MKKRMICLIVSLALIFLLCACQTQNAAQTENEPSFLENLLTQSGNYEFLRVFASLFLLLFGVINLINPKKMWEMTKGRNKKPGATEPTPAELNGERASGVIMIILGVFLYFGWIR